MKPFVQIVLVGADESSRTRIKQLLAQASDQLVIVRECDSLAMLGHELRGPLTNICLATDLIEKGTADQRMMAITTLRRAAARAEALIDELLPTDSSAIQIRDDDPSE